MIYTVIDASHYQDFRDYSALRAGGITSVILKATEGAGSFVDRTFAYRVPRMVDAGLAVAAYHFMAGTGSGKQQADFFLKTIGAFPQVKLLMMDLEQNPGAQSTVADGEDFANEIMRNLNYWPLNYMPHYGPLGDGSGLPSAVLSQCPLVIPNYSRLPTKRNNTLPAGYADWTLWQCNDGSEGMDVGPVQGLAPGSQPPDRDWFNGTAEQLAALFAMGHF